MSVTASFANVTIFPFDIGEILIAPDFRHKPMIELYRIYTNELIPCFHGAKHAPFANISSV